MTRIILVTMFALSSTSAFAADIIYSEPTAPVAPVTPVIYDAGFSWTGLYAGGMIGYIFENATEVSASNASGQFSRRYMTNDDGINGGVFGGYNFELYGLVAGVEGDFEFTDSDDSRETFGGFGTTSAAIDKQGSVRARLGYAFDRTLVYATAGLALGDVEYAAVDGSGRDSDGEIEVGYAVGAGVDFAATDRIFVRGEYRYTDYGSESFSTPVANYEFDTEAHSLRAGVGFKF